MTRKEYDEVLVKFNQFCEACKNNQVILTECKSSNLQDEKRYWLISVQKGHNLVPMAQLFSNEDVYKMFKPVTDIVEEVPVPRKD